MIALPVFNLEKQNVTNSGFRQDLHIIFYGNPKTK